jgi:hypothetical protein
MSIKTRDTGRSEARAGGVILGYRQAVADTKLR